MSIDEIQNEKLAFGTLNIRRYHSIMLKIGLSATLVAIAITIGLFISNSIESGKLIIGALVCCFLSLLNLLEARIISKLFNVQKISKEIDSVYQKNEKALEQLNGWEEGIKEECPLQAWIEMAKYFSLDDQDEIIRALYKKIYDIKEEQKVLDERRELLQAEKYETFWDYFWSHTLPLNWALFCVL